MLEIEEDYDILVGNYLDLETRMLALTTDFLIHSRIDRIDFDKDGRLANRLVSNLLASARAYCDHTKHNISSLPNNTKTDTESVNSYFSKEFAPFTYRLVDQLRNHVQHRGKPLYGFGYSAEWQDSNGIKRNKRVYTLRPYISSIALCQDPKIPKDILNELNLTFDHKGEIPLMPLVRGYMSSLSLINENVRKLFAKKKENWSDAIEKPIRDFLAITPNAHKVGICLRRLDDTDQIMEEIHLGIELKERIAFLQRSNKYLPTLEKVQVQS